MLWEAGIMFASFLKRVSREDTVERRQWKQEWMVTFRQPAFYVFLDSNRKESQHHY